MHNHKNSLVFATALLASVAFLAEAAEARGPGVGKSQFRTMKSVNVRTLTIKRSVRFQFSVPSQPRRLTLTRTWTNPNINLATKLRPTPKLTFTKKAFANVPKGKQVWFNPNGVTPSAMVQHPSPGQQYAAPSVVPAAMPPLTATDLLMRPVDRKIASLRGNLGLEPIDTVAGPGTAPLPQGPGGNAQPGAGAPSKAPDNGCIGTAKNLQNPATLVSTGRHVPTAEVQRLRERVGQTGQEVRLDTDSFSRGRHSRDTWTGKTESGDDVIVTFDRDRVTIVTIASDGSSSATAEFRGDRRRGPLSWIRTTERQADGKVAVNTPETDDAWHEAMTAHEPENTIAPTPGDSQPVDGAPDNRDYFCEAGVVTPDGPNGDRRDPPKRRDVSDLMQPGRNEPSTAIIERGSPPTPAQLKEKVVQPGVDGTVQGTKSDGPRQPAVSRFAQPPVNGTGPDGSGIGTNDIPAFTPRIPKPVDPELVEAGNPSH